GRRLRRCTAASQGRPGRLHRARRSPLEGRQRDPAGVHGSGPRPGFGPMIFTKRLRDGVRRGEITCSIRIWMRPHVKVGNRYAMDDGHIVVDSILPITFEDISPELARASGFKGVVDLLKVAKHGRGENVYLVRFHYVPPKRVKPARR